MDTFDAIVLWTITLIFAAYSVKHDYGWIAGIALVAAVTVISVLRKDTDTDEGEDEEA